MAQNIYDDPAFFEGYSQISRSRQGLAGAPEWPDVEAMLPPLEGLRILDLGCGFGAFGRYALEKGAASVHGVDLSEKMLETARERSGALPMTFERADLETYAPASGAYDLVYCALAAHYLADFDRFCVMARSALDRTGTLVMTVEHPIWAARAEPDFRTDPNGARVFAITDYAIEGRRETNWLADGVVKYHRKISTMIKALRRNALMVTDLDEWTATPQMIAQNPALDDERIRPQLLLIAARLFTKD